MDNDLARFEICNNDIWLKSVSTVIIKNEKSLIKDLLVVLIPPNSVELRWNEVEPASISNYDISCSSSKSTHVIHQKAGLQSAIVTSLPPFIDYQCCVRAYLKEKLSSAAIYTSTECTEIIIQEANVTPGFSEAGNTLTYTLAALVSVLLISVGVLSVGCLTFLVVKKKHQNKSPK